MSANRSIAQEKGLKTVKTSIKDFHPSLWQYHAFDQSINLEFGRGLPPTSFYSYPFNTVQKLNHSRTWLLHPPKQLSYHKTPRFVSLRALSSTGPPVTHLLPHPQKKGTIQNCKEILANTGCQSILLKPLQSGLNPAHCTLQQGTG